MLDRVPEELWTEVCDIVQEAVIKTIPKKKKGKKAKCLSEEALKIPEKEEKQEAKVYRGQTVGVAPWVDGPKRWQPTPVLLPGKSHGRRSLVGCSPWGR